MNIKLFEEFVYDIYGEDKLDSLKSTFETVMQKYDIPYSVFTASYDDVMNNGKPYVPEAVNIIASNVAEASNNYKLNPEEMCLCIGIGDVYDYFSNNPESLSGFENGDYVYRSGITYDLRSQNQVPSKLIENMRNYVKQHKTECYSDDDEFANGYDGPMFLHYFIISDFGQILTDDVEFNEFLIEISKF